MATKVHMEALSPTMEEGQVVRWLKSEGEDVTDGEILAEIETDKATMELSARSSGVLRRVLVQEGGTAAVGAIIGVIADADEDISAIEEEAGGGGAGEEAPAGEASEGGDAVAEEAADAPTDSAASPAPSSAEGNGAVAVSTDGRVKASPLARRLAEEAGLELARLEGSGPGGRIIKRDIESALEEGAPAAPAAAVAMPEEGSEDIQLSQMRKTIAKRLGESIGPVPHFFLTVDVDMERALEARKRVNAVLEREDQGKVSVNDLVLQVTAKALRRHPECNAHWLGDAVRRFRDVHLGVAVAIDDGLITPVIRNAHRKGLVEISREVRELAGRARDKRLQPEEYQGATFSVSNLGMFGIEEFTAVINPPEAGILAVGQVEERPVAVDGEVVVRPRMKVTMSCDHRTIDGAQGSQFLQTLKAMLEDPAVALM